jgi:hypothetical protein
MALYVSIEFVGQRAPATYSAQVQIDPEWVWPEKTIPGWEAQITAFQGQLESSLIAEAVMEVARGILDGGLEELHVLASQCLNLLKGTFRNSNKYEPLIGRVALGGSRSNIMLEARELEAAWTSIDPLWCQCPPKQ